MPLLGRQQARGQGASGRELEVPRSELSVGSQDEFLKQLPEDRGAHSLNRRPVRKSSSFLSSSAISSRSWWQPTAMSQGVASVSASSHPGPGNSEMVGFSEKSQYEWHQSWVPLACTNVPSMSRNVGMVQTQVRAQVWLGRHQKGAAARSDADALAALDLDPIRSWSDAAMSLFAGSKMLQKATLFRFLGNFENQAFDASHEFTES